MVPNLLIVPCPNCGHNVGSESKVLYEGIFLICHNCGYGWYYHKNPEINPDKNLHSYTQPVNNYNNAINNEKINLTGGISNYYPVYSLKNIKKSSPQDVKNYINEGSNYKQKTNDSSIKNYINTDPINKNVTVDKSSSNYSKPNVNNNTEVTRAGTVKPYEKDPNVVNKYINEANTKKSNNNEVKKTSNNIKINATENKDNIKINTNNTATTNININSSNYISNSNKEIDKSKAEQYLNKPVNNLNTKKPAITANKEVTNKYVNASKPNVKTNPKAVKTTNNSIEKKPTTVLNKEVVNKTSIKNNPETVKTTNNSINNKSVSYNISSNKPNINSSKEVTKETEKKYEVANSNYNNTQQNTNNSSTKVVNGNNTNNKEHSNNNIKQKSTTINPSGTVNSSGNVNKTNSTYTTTNSKEKTKVNLQNKKIEEPILKPNSINSKQNLNTENNKTSNIVNNKAKEKIIDNVEKKSLLNTLLPKKKEISNKNNNFSNKQPEALNFNNKSTTLESKREIPNTIPNINLSPKMSTPEGLSLNSLDNRVTLNNLELLKQEQEKYYKELENKETKEPFSFIEIIELFKNITISLINNLISLVRYFFHSLRYPDRIVKFVSYTLLLSSFFVLLIYAQKLQHKSVEKSKIKNTSMSNIEDSSRGYSVDDTLAKELKSDILSDTNINNVPKRKKSLDISNKTENEDMAASRVTESNTNNTNAKYYNNEDLDIKDDDEKDLISKYKTKLTISGQLSGALSKVSMKFKQLSHNTFNDLKLYQENSNWKPLSNGSNVFETSTTLENNSSSKKYLVRSLEVTFVDIKGRILSKRTVLTNQILPPLSAVDLNLRVTDIPFFTYKAYIFIKDKQSIQN